jgi:predicted ATP-dependent protease
VTERAALPAAYLNGATRMAIKPALTCDQLFRACDPDGLGFDTTADLKPAHGLIGQERALAALEFGVGIRARGFNVFALGAQGSGRHNAVRRFVEARAKGEAAPDDWVYVYNFDEPYRPKALRLPSGLGIRLAAELEELITQLKGMLPAMFEASEYRERRAGIESEFQEAQQASFHALGEKAEAQDLRILQTPTGMMIVPVHDDEPIKPEIIERMAEADRNAIEAKIKALAEELAQTLRAIPDRDKERRQRIETLNREDIPAEFHEIPELARHLTDIRTDLVANAKDFLTEDDGEAPPLDLAMNRYRANPLVRGTDYNGGAPVIYPDAPDVGYLVGRIEHIPHMGALLTDFTQIKPGALHRANGGYLMVDAERLLVSPFAWHTLKRCLRAREIVIASPLQGTSTMTYVSLEPAPVPLDVKVILFGDRKILYMMAALDPDFSELFKVAADFDDVFPRAPDSEREFCCLIAGIARDEAGLPLSAAACAAVIERAARLSGDAERLTLRIGWLADLIREADHWASVDGVKAINAAHIHKTVDQQTYRVDLIREKLQEQITRETVLIDTTGEAVGQINGLAVLQAGYLAFGKPSRITARVRMGTGKLVDIEREVEMGGPLHSADPVRLCRRALCAGRAGIAVGQPGVRAILWRGGRRQRLIDRALRAAVGTVGPGRPPGAGGHRVGQPERRGPGHRRRQREDRGVFRHLQYTRPDRRARRADPRSQRQAPDVAPRRGRGLPRGAFSCPFGCSYRRGHRDIDRARGGGTRG